MTRTTDDVINILNKFGYEFIEQYMYKNSRLVVMKHSIGYKYEIYLKNLISENWGIPFVNKSNPFSIENLSLWLIVNKKSFELYGKNIYENASKRLNFHCLICDEIFDMNWKNIYNNQGCPYCAGKRVGEYNNLEYLYPNLILEWNYKKNTIDPKKITPGSNKKAWWICRKCGYDDWNAKIYSRVSLASNCPKCSCSKGEDKVSLCLKKYKESYIFEHSFKDCIYKTLLFFDFYIPKFNLIIEYQGIQHYKPIRFSYSMSEEQAKENLRTQRIKDKIKKKYCKNNNINLLIIPYWDFEKIEELLLDTLNKLQGGLN